jgi:SAM-dependent methyltransferase
LFDQCGQRLQAIADPREIAAGSYDVVLCLDVLEHVPDPPGMVADFVRYLRDGGLLVVHAPFYFVSPANPTHLDCNRRYSGDVRRLYGSQGLELRDGRPNWDPLILEKVPPGHVARTPARASRLARLRLMGWLFAVGRYWCTPHNVLAALAVSRGDSRWLEGLGESSGE